MDQIVIEPMMDYSNQSLFSLDFLHSELILIIDKHKELVEQAQKLSHDHLKLCLDLMYYQAQYKMVEAEISKRQSSGLKFSRESIYSLFGQFDRFAIVQFYKTSESFQKFGAEICGWFIYKRKERTALEATISNENYVHTDGRVYLKVNRSSDEVTQELKENGFLASDISGMFTMDIEPLKKHFGSTEDKDYPKITVEIDYSEPNYWAIAEEQLNEMSQGSFQSKMFAAIAKKHRGELSDEEKLKIDALIAERNRPRWSYILKDLGISPKILTAFSVREPERFEEIMQAVYTFEEEDLTPFGSERRVYWDFERYAHIFLRHYKGFFIEESTNRGDKFLYEKKDIRFLAQHVIEALNSEIQESLAQDKPFRRNGNEAFYYQGDYYQIRIEADGRLMQFHPMKRI